MYGTIPGDGQQELRLYSDDQHIIHRCVQALGKVRRMAESQLADDTTWKLDELIHGLEGILRAGKILLIKSGQVERRHYEVED